MVNQLRMDSAYFLLQTVMGVEVSTFHYSNQGTEVKVTLCAQQVMLISKQMECQEKKVLDNGKTLMTLT